MTLANTINELANSWLKSQKEAYNNVGTPEDTSSVKEVSSTWGKSLAASQALWKTRLAVSSSMGILGTHPIGFCKWWKEIQMYLWFYVPLLPNCVWVLYHINSNKRLNEPLPNTLTKKGLLWCIRMPLIMPHRSNNWPQILLQFSSSNTRFINLSCSYWHLVAGRRQVSSWLWKFSSSLSTRKGISRPN